MNPFFTLGIPNNATREQIDTAYREKVRTAHPDRGGSSEEFNRITKAREQALEEWRLNEQIRIKCNTCLDTGKVIRTHGAHSMTMTCPDCQ
jgi:DnaJ-class molecular chaperone